MQHKKSKEKIIIRFLAALLFIVALNAFGGGYYGLSGANDVPLEWLSGSPFKNYFIPSLILFFCIGGTALIAGIAVIKRHRKARVLALGCALIIFIWLAVQVAIIGYVSWMQPATATAGIVIFFLALQLPKERKH